MRALVSCSPALLLLLSLLSTEPSLAVTVVTDWGTVLGTSHETYVLGNDLVEPLATQGTDDAALRIAPGTTDIVIDGAGYLIDGLDTGGVPDLDTGIAMLGKVDSVITGVRIHALRLTDLAHGIAGANHLCQILVEDCEVSGGVHGAAIEFTTVDLSPAYPPGPVAWITVRDNWIHDSSGIPVKLVNTANAGAAVESMSHLYVVGNVIHGNRRSTGAPEPWNAAILLRHGATDVRVWDNVVVMNDDLSGVFLGSDDVAGDVFDGVSIRGNQLGGQAGNIRSPGSVTASGLTLNGVTTSSGDFSSWAVSGNHLYQNALYGIDHLPGASSPPSLPADGNWWGEDGVVTGTYGNGAGNATDAAPLDLADGIIAIPDAAGLDRSLADVDGYLAHVVLLNQNDGGAGIRGFDIDYDFATFLDLERTFEGSFLVRQGFAPTTTFFDVPRIGGTGNQRTASGAILGGTVGGTGNGALCVSVLRATAGDTGPADDYLLDDALLRDPGNQPVVVLGTDDADRLVDDVDPIVTLTGPPAGTCFSATTADITFTAVDDLALEDVHYRFYKVGLDPGCWTVLSADEAGTAYSGPSPLTVTFADGDGDYTVEIRATDDAGNLAVASLTIVQDTTPPVDFSGTTAALTVPGPGTPAVEEVEVSWSGSFEAGGDLRLRFLPYGGTAGYFAYPEYDDDPGAPSPHFPGATEGTEIDLPDVASGSVVLPFALAERSDYFMTLFVVDCAGNVSPGAAPDARASALSYYLGDWDGNAPPACAGSPSFVGGNGEVDFCDLIGLSLTFGTVEGDVDYHAEADIGPTTPGPGVLDLPTTDNVIDFEDLILFAIDFGNVSPLVGDVRLAETTAPGVLGIELGRATVSGERLVVPLDLAGNLRDVKGFEATLVARGLHFLGAERAPAASGEQVFLDARARQVAADAAPGEAATGETVVVSAAVLGAGQVFEGAGTVAWLEFEVTAPRHALRVAASKLRSSTNQELGGLTTTAIDAGRLGSPPGVLAFHPAEPNPFNPQTTLRFEAPGTAQVAVRIYDPMGRLVRTLVDRPLEAGAHAVTWDGRDAAGTAQRSGLYLAEIQVGATRHVEKLVLVK